MRKILLCLLTVALGVLIQCGGGSSTGGSTPPATPQVTSFAFLQDAPGQGALTPMLGTFTVTGSQVQFKSAAAAIDSSTGQPVSALISSIMLSADARHATFDMFGGTLDAPSNQWDIWVAGVSGSNVGLTQLTNDTYGDFMPQFSPDGRKVVFVSDNVPGISVAVMNADGTGNEQLLPIPPNAEVQLFPTYSPDGSKIAVEVSAYDPNTSLWSDGIWIMNSDGSNPTMLTNASTPTCSCGDTMPAFSADGSKIFFSRLVFNSTADQEDVYVMNVDGSGVTKLTDSVGANYDPMPLNIAGLGQKVLFSSNRSNPGDTSDHYYDLYSMNTDGTGISPLTTNQLFDAFSGWMYWQGGSGASAARYQRARSRLLDHHPTYRSGPPPDWR